MRAVLRALIDLIGIQYYIFIKRSVTVRMFVYVAPSINKVLSRRSTIKSIAISFYSSYGVSISFRRPSFTYFSFVIRQTRQLRKYRRISQVIFSQYYYLLIRLRVFAVLKYLAVGALQLLRMILSLNALLFGTYIRPPTIISPSVISQSFGLIFARLRAALGTPPIRLAMTSQYSLSLAADLKTLLLFLSLGSYGGRLGSGSPQSPLELST